MLTAADYFRICRSSRILPNQKSLILNRALIVTAVEKKQILLFNRRANGAQRAKKPLARLARGCVSIFTIHFLSSVFRACPAAKSRKAPSTKTAIYFRSPDRKRKVSATRMKRSLHCHLFPFGNNSTWSKLPPKNLCIYIVWEAKNSFNRPLTITGTFSGRP